MKNNIKQIFESCDVENVKLRKTCENYLELNARIKDYVINKKLLGEMSVLLARQAKKLQENIEEISEKNEKLEKLTLLKNKFLGMAAHDLRNPIGNVQMLSELLLEEMNENLTGDQKNILSEIINLSRFMLNLLNDLLDISAIESGNVKLDLQELDYVKLIEDILSLNRPLAEKKKITVDFSYEKDIPPVNIDKNKIIQVIINLLTNAVKFSYPETNIKVEVVKQGDFLLTSFTDQGQGIPSAEIPNIFKEFHKTSVKATAGEKSTGLGLAIIKKIIEVHGGKIDLESQVGKGTRFYFTLPVNKR